MKQRNYYRVAALLLAVMMTLGLAACGGSGSGGQVDQPQKNDHSANTVWNGLWVGEDEVLQIMSDESIALLFYVETDGFYKGAQNNFDEVYSYSYTIDGNVLKLKTPRQRKPQPLRRTLTDLPAQAAPLLTTGITTAQCLPEHRKPQHTTRPT